MPRSTCLTIRTSKYFYCNKKILIKMIVGVAVFRDPFDDKFIIKINNKIFP